jgi:biotin synthase
MSERLPYSRDEVRRLLTVTGAEQHALFARARAVRREYCGDGVLLRGLIEISNYCQKQCDYCGMRRNNKNLERSRLTADQIIEIVAEIKRQGLNIAFLQAGQDPGIDKMLEKVIPAIKRDIGLPVLLNLGERDKRVYQRYVELGADSYILKIEASDPELYQQVIHAPIQRRLDCTRWIREVGMKLGTGNIVGLPGQTLDHIVGDIFFAAELRPDFVSSSPLIPNEDTPYENAEVGSIDVTLNTMAILRIMLGDPLIPTVSPLEKIQKGGQLAGLNAGANVMTINFTPTEVRENYVIYSRERFVVTRDHALRTIEKAGLHPVGRRTVPVESNGAIEANGHFHNEMLDLFEPDEAYAAFEHRHVTAPLLFLGRLPARPQVNIADRP